MMEKITNLLIGVILIGCISFGIFKYNSITIDKSNKDKMDKLERQIEFQRSYIQTADSTIFALQDEKEEEAEKAKRYRRLWKYESDKADSIENAYDDIQKDIDSLSLDSLAKYIIDNYAGKHYKIEKVSDTVYMAFEDTTIRDVAKTHVDYEKRGEIIDNKDNQIEFLDSLQSKLSKELLITEGINHSLTVKVDTLESINTNYSELLDETQKEAIRERKLKIVSYVVNGIQFIVILAIAL